MTEKEQKIVDEANAIVNMVCNATSKNTINGLLATEIGNRLGVIIETASQKEPTEYEKQRDEIIKMLQDGDNVSTARIVQLNQLKGQNK